MMAKKDKDFVELPEYVDDEDDEESIISSDLEMPEVMEEGQDSTDIDNMVETYGDEDIPSNAMGLAWQITRESDTIKNFRELPKEARLSFYDAAEKQEIKHYARTYRNWKWIEKIIDIRTKEDIVAHEKHISPFNVHNKQSLINYVKNKGCDYLINDIDDMSEEDIDKIVGFMQKMKPNYFSNKIQKDKTKMNTYFKEYRVENQTPEYIDDMGNVAKIADTSIASMGFKGNAAQHSVMTINAVKNEDISRESEEKTRFSLLDSIRRKFG